MHKGVKAPGGAKVLLATAAQWAKLKASTQTWRHPLTLGILKGQDELKKLVLVIYQSVIY